MSKPVPYTVDYGYWNTPWSLMLRVKTAADEDIQIDEVYSIDVTVWEISKPNDQESLSFDPADSVYDTLQTGMGWDVAAKPNGFNTRLEFDGTLTPKPDTRYRHLIEMQMQDGTEIRHIHDQITFSRTRVGGG